ncbi:MAG: maleylpyruvate isomerase N-terminal domain-containing protein [Anaerolineales bacterium]|nr:maleylpyruvate isomerase N-terminal domain-containing protein [Anaerolineales bacterium]
MELPDIQSIFEENAAEHRRLVKCIADLTDEQLSRPLDSGWTVAALLAHLAFWDARAVVLMEKWRRTGIGPSPADVDVINDAVKELCLAIPPRAAAELAVRKSLEVNRMIESLSTETAEAIQTRGTAVHLRRYEHKRIHLADIERALGNRH